MMIAEPNRDGHLRAPALGEQLEDRTGSLMGGGLIAFSIEV